MRAAAPPCRLLQASLRAAGTRASALPRLFASPLPERRFALPAEEAKHVRALRLRHGDALELFDGDGSFVECSITGVDARGAVEVEPRGQPHSVPWSGAAWTLAVAVSSLGARADWLVEKAAELGVRSFCPLFTKNCQRASQQSELARWGRVSLAASKQSQRLHGMRVLAPASLPELLASSPHVFSLVALQGGVNLQSLLSAHPDQVASGGLLLVGPPGDFTEEEKDTLLAAGAHGVSLGPHRLRTETAALALVSACSAASWS